jgi:hypothetical protein
MSSGESILENIRAHIKVIEDDQVQDQSNAKSESETNHSPPEKLLKNKRSSGVEYENMLNFLLAGSHISSRLSPNIKTNTKNKNIDNNLIVDIIACSFVVCECGLDFAIENENTAELWVIENNKLNNSFSCRLSSSLHNINSEVIKEDKFIADRINRGEIHAIISISSDPSKCKLILLFSIIYYNKLYIIYK